MRTMRFILETSQDVKSYTARRIWLGERKGSIKPVQQLLNEWLGEYLRQNRIAEDAPRFALRDAMNEILTYGVKTPPEERIDWEGFSVEPRKGWSKEKKAEEPGMTWDQYMSGKTKKVEGDNRTVKPDLAVRSLYEQGIVRFRWGSIHLRGPYEDRLTIQAARAGIPKEDFLRRVTQIDLVRVKEETDNWKVNFILE